MPPFVATVVYSFGIWGLFFLNRDRKNRPPQALWLPVAWLLISGSRPLSSWLQGSAAISPEQLMEGSPFDRVVYLALQVAGLVVLLGRQPAVTRFLRANAALLVFVFYCAASVFWSDYPDVTFKRWIKLLGDLTMVSIVLTSPDPLRAIKTVITRVGFVLIPASMLLIKYYPQMARYYDPWTGQQFVSGVGTDKNMLGMICLVYGLGILWQFLAALREPRSRDRTRRLIANGIFLASLFWLFSSADSMTSLSCFFMGSFLIVATTFLKIARKPAMVHTLAIGIAGAAFAILFLHVGESAALKNLGRTPTLSGRTEIWAGLLQFQDSPVLGAGFDSFWLGERLTRVWSAGGLLNGINEAHDGYLETYLNLGWIGVACLTALIVTGYGNILRALRTSPEMGRIKLALFVVAVVYSYTEAAFRETATVWIAFLLAISAVPDVRIRKRDHTLNAGNVTDAESGAQIAVISHQRNEPFTSSAI